LALYSYLLCWLDCSNISCSLLQAGFGPSNAAECLSFLFFSITHKVAKATSRLGIPTPKLAASATTSDLLRPSPSFAASLFPAVDVGIVEDEAVAARAGDVGALDGEALSEVATSLCNIAVVLFEAGTAVVEASTAAFAVAQYPSYNPNILVTSPCQSSTLRPQASLMQLLM